MHDEKNDAQRKIELKLHSVMTNFFKLKEKCEKKLCPNVVLPNFGKLCIRSMAMMIPKE